MGEAEEVEVVLRVVTAAASGSEVHEARLGGMEHKPMLRKTLAQNGEHPLPVPAILEGNDKVIGKAYQPAGPDLSTRHS